MSKILRSPSVSRVLMLTSIGILPFGLLLFGAPPSLACSPESYEASAQYPPDQDPPGMDPSGLLPSEDEMLGRGNRTRSKGARKKARPADKSKKTSPDDKAKSTADDGRLKFSQDIAPILVANCVGCHSGDGNGVRRGKLDLSTFEKLQDRKSVV